MKCIDEEMVIKKLCFPGFYEAIVITSKLFEFKSPKDILKHWRYIKQYLGCYEVSVPPTSGDSKVPQIIKPFNTEEDLEIAKYVMINLYY